MPTFSFKFHCPRFLRFHSSRSQSPKSSPAGPRNGDTTYPLLDPDQSHALCAYPPSRLCVSEPQRQTHGIFHEAHDLTVTGTFIDGNVGSVNFSTSNQFMEKLLKETIPGAASDSSERDPPPRCHPGTRLAILDRCLDFIRNCNGQKKILWVVGAAGVGKSAIMQSVAESPELPVGSQASVFFSINGRNDGTKAIITISYQLAAKPGPYRQVIENEITLDPSLLRSSMAKQFLKLIIEPFSRNDHLDTAGRVLVIIDGLDECQNSRTQLELLRLISNFCINCPSSPFVWLIASRPETHITSFFASEEVKPTYEREEIVVDSDEARADVERFLRHELMKIKKQASDSLDPLWPEERHIWKLANASGGLFAYAATVSRYIGDSRIGSPASQLSDVLKVIENHALTGISPEEHPMALLDALYARILSNIPPRIMINTRKLLLVLASDWDWDYHNKGTFVVLCNWLSLMPDEAYAALNHLRSVLYVPRRDEAHHEILRAFHKSFIDFICDFPRSGFSRDIRHEATQLMKECTFRIVKELPDDIDLGDASYEVFEGSLARGPANGDNISLTWPVDKGIDWDDKGTRWSTYKLAMGEVVAGMERGDPAFQSVLCIRLLTNRFGSYDGNFPRHKLRDVVFDESRRHEFMKHGILRFMPLKELDISFTTRGIKSQFRQSATIEITVPDPWNSSCNHERQGVWGKGSQQNWTTVFWRSGCDFCFQQLERQFESLTAQSPNSSATILFTSTGECCVECRFVDLQDGMSEWTYWFWMFLTAEERKKHGSTV